jgi:hypothetical protein
MHACRQGGQSLHAGHASQSGAHGVRALPEPFVVPPIVIYGWMSVTEKFQNATIALFIDSSAFLRPYTSV